MKTKIYKRKNWNVDTPLHKGLNSLELNIEESSKNLVADLEVVSQSLDYIDSKNIEQDNRISSLETTSNDLVPRVEYLETEVSTIRSDMEGIVSGELNNVYTKAEADSKFVGKTATTVSIEDKSLLFHNTVVNLETGTTSQGKINISEDGLDVKSNHSVSVVVNEDNLGDGYFRVYTGSGRRPLLEVGDRIFRYGENASKIYHEEFKPTKTDVGLSKVENLTKSEIITGLSTTTELTNAVSTLNTSIDGKLGKTETATNSSKLENFTKDQIVTEAKNGMAVDSLVTTSTKGLMSNSDKAKLDGIANNANNYSHPSTHPASIIVEDSTHRFMTDEEKSSITYELSRLESSKLDKSTYSGTAQDLKTEINTKANSSNTITAGNGLQGGGTLGSNVSLSIKPTNESLIVDETGIKANIVDDLTSGGINKALSAEQGKVLKQLIDTIGSGGTQKLLREAELMSTYEYIGTLSAGGTSIMVGTNLFNPKLFLDGTRIDPNQFSFESATGLITLNEAYSADYSVVWFVEDQPDNHIAFCFPTMNLLTSDTAMKNKIEIGDVIKILGSSDADDGGHYLVKCSATAGLNAVNIGSNKYLNEIANTKMSGKLDKSGGEISDTLKIGNNLIIGSNSIVDAKSFGNGLGQTPTISLAIGDSDTGFNWLSDGNVEAYANNTKLWNLKDVYHTGKKPTANDIGTIGVSFPHTSNWTSAGAMSGKTYCGGIHLNSGTSKGYFSFGNSSSQTLDFHLDGEYYCTNGENRVYHTGFKPTPTDIGAVELDKINDNYIRSIKIDGDANTYYPVLIKYNSYSDFKKNPSKLTVYKFVHDLASNDGSFTASFENLQSNGWGNFATEPTNYSVRLSSNYTKFLGNYHTSQNADSNFVLYLKGGGRTYHFSSDNINLSTNLSVHYSQVESSGSQAGYERYVSPTTVCSINSNYHRKRIMKEDMPSSLSITGFSSNINGPEKQWGKISEDNPVVYFPLSFKEECTNIVIEDSFDGGATDTSSAKIINKTRHGFEIAGLTGTKNWIAFGY